MRSRKRDWRCQLPPEGFMWLGKRGGIKEIAKMEALYKQEMERFDACCPYHPEYWENDPSYHWVAEAKRKKALTRGAKGRI